MFLTQKPPLGAQDELPTQTCKYFLELLLCSLQSEPVLLSLLILGELWWGWLRVALAS